MKIAWMGATDRVDCSYDVKGIIRAAGMNIGNLVIGDALKNILSYHASLNVPDPRWLSDEEICVTAAELNNTADCVVIAASNFVNPHFDGTRWAMLLEKLKVPVITFGIGAQSSLNNEIPTISSGLKRMLQVLSGLCVSIGARGKFSAEVLSYYGIDNVSIIGCPSFYRNPEGVRSVPDYLNLSAVESVGINWHRNLSPRLAEFILLMKKCTRIRDVLFFIQDEAIKRDGSFHENYTFSSLIPEVYNLDDRVLMDLRFSSILPADLSLWRFMLRRLCFSVGLRFHGNIMALQCGVPALVLVHDSRTYELCEALSIPFFVLGQGVDAQDFWRQERFTFYEMKNRYSENLRRFCEFCSVNGLATKIKNESWSMRV